MTIAAVITARGGSKGLPRKNLAPLAGKPLIAWTIEAARGCSLVSACYVSTEDAEIAAVSRAYGADVIQRPTDLARDTTPSADVVIHALNHLRQQAAAPEAFALLQPTSPLRNARTLTGCIEKFQASGARSLVSVAEAEHHPFKALTISGDKLTPLRQWSDLTARRQDLPRAVHPNGAVYLAYTAEFLADANFFAPPLAAFEMSREDSVDIDNAFDLQFAELIVKNRAGNV